MMRADAKGEFSGAPEFEDGFPSRIEHRRRWPDDVEHVIAQQKRVEPFELEEMVLLALNRRYFVARNRPIGHCKTSRIALFLTKTASQFV